MEPEDILSRTPEQISQECKRLIDTLLVLISKMPDDAALVQHDARHHVLQLKGAQYQLDNGLPMELASQIPAIHRIVKQARIYTRALQWRTP